MNQDPLKTTTIATVSVHERTLTTTLIKRREGVFCDD